jgi:hypothetical protein
VVNTRARKSKHNGWQLCRRYQLSPVCTIITIILDRTVVEDATKYYYKVNCSNSLLVAGKGENKHEWQRKIAMGLGDLDKGCNSFSFPGPSSQVRKQA